MANPKIGVMFGPHISFYFLLGIYDVEYSPEGKEGIGVSHRSDAEAIAAAMLESRTPKKIGIGTKPTPKYVPL